MKCDYETAVNTKGIARLRENWRQLWIAEAMPQPSPIPTEDPPAALRRQGGIPSVFHLVRRFRGERGVLLNLEGAGSQAARWMKGINQRHRHIHLFL
jgi:hypothetical protein